MTGSRDTSPRGHRRIAELLQQIRQLAIDYYELTGKPLGVTAEIAEFEAARLLGLELAPARQPGYDAVRTGNRGPKKIQIKGRRYLNKNPGQRVGKIDLRHEWDSVVLVLLDKDYRVTEIYEAKRAAIEEALMAPGSRARN